MADFFSSSSLPTTHGSRSTSDLSNLKYYDYHLLSRSALQ